MAGGEIRYYVSGGMGGGRGGTDSIASWVEASFTSTTVGNSTVYDLTKPLNAS